ncbi:MAG TPA: tyrosine-type recombinase/integrase, partial [Methylomirabilota bacterium]|nr:tyrosine-type recombinase/integrase [Methylomirabilota bacterium]
QTNAQIEAPNPENVITLPRPRLRQAVAQSKRQKFKICPFVNERTGSRSWRVAGSKRDGTRVRENFADEAAARCRQIELETEFLRGAAETNIRATKLTAEQIQLAEVAVIKLGEDWSRLLDAVDFWKTHANKNAPKDSPRIDDAVEQFLAWLTPAPFRDATKRNWKYRLGVFKNSVQNVRVSEVTPDFIDDFLTKRDTTPGGKDTDRRAVSRFFSWCIERPRRWVLTNPCRDVKVPQGQSAPPSVLSVDQCQSLLRAAEAHKDGLLAPYVAVCLFGGLRPFEAGRLPWAQVNLKDKEILLEATQTKTNTSRTVTIEPTLAKWLKAYKGCEFFPANWRKEFDAVRAAAGITEWPHDVMRHTAISHHFRKHKSYGKAAEQFGNSEAIIKKHYQGRVNSNDTKKFYALAPTKKTGRATRTKMP